MANEKRLIDANRLKMRMIAFATAIKREYLSIEAIVDTINTEDTVDAVEVVYCDECKSHGSCMPEDTFRWMRIEKPYCCVGKRKTNTNFEPKMDGDGNG